MIPVSAGLVVIALPMMRLVAFGSATKTGPALLAAGMASLALGLYPYGAFLLLARSYYALGDSRTPAIVAIGSALLGVIDDDRREPPDPRRGARRRARHRPLDGVSHRGDRAGHRLPASHRPIDRAARVADCDRHRGRDRARGVDRVLRALDPSGRPATVACLALVGGIGTGVYAVAVRRWWRAPSLIAADV